MVVRLPVVLVSVVLSFLAGLGAYRRLVPEAHAQSAALASTIYVPSDGLAFRSFDGRVIARMTYDSHGGAFELYDEHEQPAMRVRGDALAHPASTGRSAARGSVDLGF